MKVARGVHAFPDSDMPGTYGYRCSVCRITIHGYPTPHSAKTGARIHYATVRHLDAEKARVDAERRAREITDAVFALVFDAEAEAS